MTVVTVTRFFGNYVTYSTHILVYYYVYVF